MFGARFGIPLTLALLGTGACTPVPRDAEKTLEHVQQRHIVRVGVVESPPWVVRESGQPSGLPEQTRKATQRGKIFFSSFFGRTGCSL